MSWPALDSTTPAMPEENSPEEERLAGLVVVRNARNLAEACEFMEALGLRPYPSNAKGMRHK